MVTSAVKTETTTVVMILKNKFLNGYDMPVHEIRSVVMRILN